MPFRLFNALWLEADLSHEDALCHILTFDVVPMAADFGDIERISNCVPLRRIARFFADSSPKKAHLAKLVTSAVLRVSEATLFHIDFGFCVGETLFMDASPFGITQSWRRR